MLSKKEDGKKRRLTDLNGEEEEEEEEEHLESPNSSAWGKERCLPYSLVMEPEQRAK